MTLSLLGLVLFAMATADPIQSPRPETLVNYLDGDSIVRTYFQQSGLWIDSQPRFYLKAYVTDILEIPLGDVEEPATGAKQRAFYLEFLTVDDIRGSKSYHLIYIGTRSLYEEGYVPMKEYCLQYAPLKNMRTTLGDLLGLKDVSGGKTLFSSLHHVLFDNLDGVLVLIPGTRNVCWDKIVFTISVRNPDGLCRDTVDGTTTTFECERRVGEGGRSYASMMVDQTHNPVIHCESTVGEGACNISGYSPKEPPKLYSREP